MCFPAPMVENAKGFLENALMCWWIGEEGVRRGMEGDYGRMSKNIGRW